ncbi:hypothetical protein Vadar_017787 [Vaccinium darrowii]|uniref:Uncharacterized protein n=1 Tax=Vaccinium darrowii TaxID=229202 RepID=A0ACB7XIL2_9ERIC|nr:hypothetical protein Vadar_017787 [Vaccinium darrowii]
MSWRSNYQGPAIGHDINATPEPTFLPPHYQERTYGETAGIESQSLPTYEETARTASKYLPLYKAILKGDWDSATKFFIKEPNGIRDAITLEYSETALMVAVQSSERNHIVTNLIEMMTEEEVAQGDIYGQTALVKAVQSGNYEAARLLVAKNRELPSIMVEEIFSVHWAATLGHREMVVYLLEKTAVGVDPSPFEGPTGLHLLNCLAYGGLYVPPIKSVRETKLMHHQALKFVKHLCEEAVKPEHFSRASDVLSGPMLDSATVGTCEIVEEILESFPSGIRHRNIKDQNIFHAAIENRQENVFNLIYQLEKNQRGVFLLQTDESGNNALHMAGNLRPMQQLSLRASVACPALQMQRELQWFKAVKELFVNFEANTRNNTERTPQELFSDTHKDLVEKGEKWMKHTASSCTLVAVLIVTVVFAAAIIVPGGYNTNGFPIFLGDRVFVLFGVSDSLALFSSTTSLLMFLSILTSRYDEQDFLYALPRKLIIGLFTLFLSIIAMMVAFAATLKIVFGHKRAWITIYGVALSCVPVTLFALLLFPLLVRMIKSTYFPRIFRKRSKRIFY